MVQSSATMSLFWNEPTADRPHFPPNGQVLGHNGAVSIPYNYGSSSLGGGGSSRSNAPFHLTIKSPLHHNQQQHQQQQHAHNVSIHYQYRTAEQQGLETSGIVSSTPLVKSDLLAPDGSSWVFANASKLPHASVAPTSSILDGFSGNTASSHPAAISSGSIGSTSGANHAGNATPLLDNGASSFLPGSGGMANATSYPLSQSMAGAPMSISQPMQSVGLAAPVSNAPPVTLAVEPLRRSIDINIDSGSAGTSYFGTSGQEMNGSKPSFGGSSASPGSSNGRLGSSPEGHGRTRNSGFGDSTFPASTAPMANVDAWMASSLNLAPGTAPSSSTDMAASHVRSSSVQYTSAAQPGHSTLTRQQQQQQQQQQQNQSFKTSIERRERNKASQRESRKRRQDRLEMLEAENAALRKALASTKYDKAGRGAGSKFSGAIFLDVIEPHLEDNSAEQGFSELIGHRFPEQKSEAQEVFNELDVYDPREKEEDAGEATDAAISGSAFGEAAEIPEEQQMAKSSGPVRSGRGSQPKRKNVWELGISHHESSKSFTSLVVVPELVLYKVCRLYFSLVLPFTTSLKSGICNLRAARAAPFLLGGPDELPRFKGDSFDETRAELVLPQNLMPTENQLRIGFHPVEIAVIPFPSMRDKLLTTLEAFHSLGGIEDVPNGARITEEHRAFSPPSTHPDVYVGKMQQRTAIISDVSTWTPKDQPDPKTAIVIPDHKRVYKYGFTEKPKGSPKMGRPAQRFLDDFFVEVVRSLRIWTPAGDVFDQEGFELRESFYEKYPWLVDENILRSTNRWRRARGESPIRL